ncbi:MAG: CoA transferase [Candidatus Nezhaarchaeota archaeon]|nr:CoA transferase [Candidatus Nezhaarchaeota archaeon]
MSVSRRDELLAKLFSFEGKPSALSGVNVVEISKSNLVGSMVGGLLRELGAEVVRVESPGDSTREISPYGARIKGVGIPYLIENVGKKIVHLDLENEKDREELRNLLLSCDVVIDATKPGYLDSIGLGYRDISNKNPKVVYLAISPYGHFSKESKELCNIPDSDLTAQARNGYPSLIGNPSVRPIPLRAGIWAAWSMAAICAVTGVLIALYERLRSGKGQFVDIATHEALAAVHQFPIIVGFLFGRSRPQYGFIDYILYPFGVYKTKDGYVTIATPYDTDFRAFLKLINRWDLEPDWRYATDRVTDDVDRIVELDKEVRKELSKFSTSELIKRATRRGFLPEALRRLVGRPVIVRSYTLKETLSEKHWYIRSSLLKANINGKEILVPNSPFRMSETPGRMPIEKLKEHL